MVKIANRIRTTNKHPSLWKSRGICWHRNRLGIPRCEDDV